MVRPALKALLLVAIAHAVGCKEERKPGPGDPPKSVPREVIAAIDKMLAAVDDIAATAEARKLAVPAEKYCDALAAEIGPKLKKAAASAKASLDHHAKMPFEAIDWATRYTLFGLEQRKERVVKVLRTCSQHPGVQRALKALPGLSP